MKYPLQCFLKIVSIVKIGVPVSRKLRDMVLVTSPEGAYFADAVHKEIQHVLERRVEEYAGMDPSAPLYGWTAAERREETERFLNSYRNFVPVRVDYTAFAVGEIKPKIQESVRGRDVYAFHAFIDGSGRCEVYRSPFALQLINYALRDAKAAGIIDILPNYPWQRQDRKDEGRVPISARVMSDNIQRNINGILTMDMHSEQQQGFFDIAVDHLYAMPLFVTHYNHTNQNDIVVVAPDPGAARRARGLAKRLTDDERTNIAIIDKRRDTRVAHEVYVYHLIGEELVKGKRAIIIDDMIDTGDTTIKAAQRVREAGATYVSVCATHAIFSPKNGMSAEEKLCDSPYIDEVVVTDTIPPRSSYSQCNDKIKVLSAAPLFAEAIYEIQTGGSVSRILAEDRDLPKPNEILAH